MISEDPAQLWRERGRRGRCHPSLAFVEDRLELGESAVLARLAFTPGALCLAFEGGEERARARLTAAYLRRVPDGALDALSRGACSWAAGDPALAYIHLALAGLAQFENPELAAYRLFLADYLLDEKGLAPSSKRLISTRTRSTRTRASASTKPLM